MPTQQSGSKRIDRRVLRTRKAIMGAFDKIVSNGNIDKITVSAIAREADIDRKTFYLHYKSIDDLINCKTEEILEQLLEPIKVEGAGKTHSERVHMVLAELNAMLTSNIPFYTSIARKLTTDQVLERFSRFTDSALAYTELNPDVKSNQQLRMRMQFFIAGAIFLYSNWLKSDHSQPIETVSSVVEETLLTMHQQCIQMLARQS